ncbi:MAG: hypothetical protein ABI601_16185, partial [bacterium]
TPWVVQGPLIATVAAVATVATVARVARIAAPGAPLRGEAALPASPAAPATGAVQLAAQRNSGADQGGHTGSGARDSRQQREETPLGAASDARAGERTYSAMDRSQGGSMDASLIDATSDVRPSSAARAADALDAREAAAPRTLARLTLSLDDGLGGQDHVRIGMRGMSVGASFDIRDASSADRVASRMGELTRALEQRGLEPQSLQVRSSMSREAELGRTATQTTDAMRSVATTSAPRNDARADSGSDARQRFTQHDEQHERARREQDEQRRRDSTFFLHTETT